MALLSNFHSHEIREYGEVSKFIDEFRRIIKQGNFKVAEREEKNLPFIRKYNLASRQRQADLLLQLCAEDYLHTVKSNMEGNEGQDLHVFVKTHPLFEMMGGLAEVLAYIEIDLIAGNEPVRCYRFVPRGREGSGVIPIQMIMTMRNTFD